MKMIRNSKSDQQRAVSFVKLIFIPSWGLWHRSPEMAWISATLSKSTALSEQEHFLDTSWPELGLSSWMGVNLHIYHLLWGSRNLWGVCMYVNLGKAIVVVQYLFLIFFQRKGCGINLVELFTQLTIFYHKK